MSIRNRAVCLVGAVQPNPRPPLAPPWQGGEWIYRCRDSEIAPTMFWLLHCASSKLIPFPHLTLTSKNFWRDAFGNSEVLIELGFAIGSTQPTRTVS